MKDPLRRMHLCFVARLSWVQNAKILCQDTGQKEMLQPTPRKAPYLEPSVRNSLQFGCTKSWNVPEMLELSSASSSCFCCSLHHFLHRQMLQPAPGKGPNWEPPVWNSLQVGCTESWNALGMLELSYSSSSCFWWSLHKFLRRLFLGYVCVSCCGP